jgi:hypothetical protein
VQTASEAQELHSNYTELTAAQLWFLQDCGEECDLQPITFNLWRIREDLIQPILRPTKIVFMHRENLRLPPVLQNMSVLAGI